MERNPERRCETCVFWKPNTGGARSSEYGACTRYPPTVVGGLNPHTTDSEDWSEWPSTHADEGCGEHRTQQEDAQR